jgi:hypothetical protein
VSTATVDWSHVAGDLLALMRGRLFMTVTEGAKILDVDPRTLRRSIEANDCPHVRVSGTIRIPVGPFLRWAGIDLEDAEAGAGTPATANDDLATTRKIDRPVDNELNGYSDGTESGVWQHARGRRPAACPAARAYGAQRSGPAARDQTQLG